MQMIKVDMISEGAALLIIQHPTGISYEIQCGGMCCWQKPVEGFVVDSLSYGLPQALEMESWGKLREEEVEQIQSAISNHGHSFANIGVEVSKVLIDESCEAFVMLEVIWNGEPHSAVLTWENCD